MTRSKSLLSPPVRLLRLERLMAQTAGDPRIAIAVIDGPVDTRHGDLAGSRFDHLAAQPGSCRVAASAACRHGTFVSGLLAARRGSVAPALCPGCRFLLRPIFPETAPPPGGPPQASPEELASALREVMAAGARLVNLSLGLTGGGGIDHKVLWEAFEEAARRGVLVVAAAGNDRRLGAPRLTRHPWVLPVVACDLRGRVLASANLGPSVGRRGLTAPGAGVHGLAPGGGRGTLTGSSVAAPFVTGTLALLWSLRPRAQAREVREALLLPGERRHSLVPPLLDAEAGRRRLLAAVSPPPAVAPITSSRPRAAVTPSTLDQKETTMASQQPTTLAADPASTELETPASPAPASPPPPTAPPASAEAALVPAAEAGGCGCGCSSAVAAPPAYVYAIGTIEARFPSLGVEKEFLQATERVDTTDLSDRQVFHATLSAADNRYLARSLCYVLRIEGIDTYVIQPNSEEVLSQLVAATRPTNGSDCDVVIGQAGGIAPPGLCNGLQAPIVYTDRIYSFQVEDFVDAIPRPKRMKEQGFKEAARELFERILQLADNSGRDDEHRALNYVILRYGAIYANTVERYAEDFRLAGVDVRPARLSDSRKVVSVVFRFEHRKTGVTEQYFTRVDVTEQWPFLVTRLQRFFDREP